MYTNEIEISFFYWGDKQHISSILYRTVRQNQQVMKL